MNRNYPIVLFTIVSVGLFTLQQYQRRAPAPSIDALHVLTPPAEPSANLEVKALPPSDTFRTVSEDEGIIWFFKDTPQIKAKIGVCAVRPLLSESEVESSTRYWRKEVGGALQLFTPRQATIDGTMTAHINTLACLYHPEIEASDPVTTRRFDHINFPRDKSTEAFPLDIFFQLVVEDGTAQSRGMRRLGHPEIRIRSDVEVPQDILWRVITLSLSGQPLEQLLPLDPMSLQIQSRTQHLLTIIAERKEIKQQVPQPKAVPLSPSSRARKAINRSAPSRVPVPIKRLTMPEYR